ncbi:MAG: diphosphate--fructose-6-phosphate 1-phosphotransferase [Peptoniphilaceae bacterium]|nr:diphosphate--fructose-6-phosphate 1-phosphotransferase [Peptoniphilaceae bacterium]MDD7382800.1 diphosphate--fructose-6-phosphate 1-phosphotransferase [Peptoniphilaceae bacterium]MDY3737958.1 diphosphate--fructose-6-phosphate 1-phosphotransferase [Peptoniphilaceae bacterium]
MNYLIVHGGGPTSVINASLYGVVKRLLKEKDTKHVYGAIGGIKAIYDEKYIDFSSISKFEIESLLITPGTALGSSRYPLEEDDYEEISAKLNKQHIDVVFLNGGNGTMNTCGELAKHCKKYSIRVIGIPKTMDNDIAETDHSPGFGSAANYIVNTVSEICMDVKSLPIHVCIVETMGRNAGWLAASSSLSKTEFCDGPDLIYTPEFSFDENEFLEEINKLNKKKKGIVVVVSEGLVDKNGNPIMPPIFESGRSIYYGDVSAHLSQIIINKLKIKARNEKPGLAGRASILYRSQSDLNEAIEVGKKAADAAISGENAVMVGIQRESIENYNISYPLIPVDKVMLYERKMPKDFLNEKGNWVSEKYIKWAKPIVDFKEIPYISYNEN